MHPAAPCIGLWRAEHFPSSGSSSVHRVELSSVLKGYLAPPLLGRCENLDGIAPGPGFVLPQPGKRRRPGLLVKYGTVGRCSPCEWAGPRRCGRVQKEVEGYSGHSRNYFQEEVTCVSSWGTFQIPLPCDSWGSTSFTYFAHGAPPLCRQGTPEPPGSRRKKWLRRTKPRSAVGANPWRTGLHKHPQPSTCPRLPAPLMLADHGARVPKLVPLFSCYTKLTKWPRPETPSYRSANPAHSQPWEKGLGPGGSGASPLRVPWSLILSGAVLAGRKGISCSSPLLEFTDVATNFQSLPLSWLAGEHAPPTVNSAKWLIWLENLVNGCKPRINLSRLVTAPIRWPILVRELVQKCWELDAFTPTLISCEASCPL